jgi:hypothetical protein
MEQIANLSISRKRELLETQVEAKQKDLDKIVTDLGRQLYTGGDQHIQKDRLEKSIQHDKKRIAEYKKAEANQSLINQIGHSLRSHS